MYPRVGVGVIIMRRENVLMRKRVHAHGKGTWELVGGHLEFGESIEGCAVREAQEEIGVRIENVRVGPVTNDVFVEENKH